MSVGIFWVLLMLIAAVDINQLLFSSKESQIVSKNREEILQRMKDQEVSLRLLHLRLQKEIADLESKQDTLRGPPLKLKIQQYLYKVLLLTVITLFKLWR